LKELRARREEILAAAARWGGRDLRIFGSVARGEAGPHSDVDILLDMEKDRSLMDMGGLLMDLQDLLDCRVDLVTEAGLHWYIKDRVLKEAVPL
jgi:predicted nucleotidyltransferase